MHLQALVATALGLPCTYFRRLLQNNAAMSCLLIKPTGNPLLECLNQSPDGGSLLKQDDKMPFQIAVVAHTTSALGMKEISMLIARSQVRFSM